MFPLSWHFAAKNLGITIEVDKIDIVDIQNKVVLILKITAFFVFVVGFIFGLSSDLGETLKSWLSSFASGMIIYGIAEIISLLLILVDKK